MLTTPNNPSGLVWKASEVRRLVELCRSVGAWLVADQTYHQFLFGAAVHTFPCSQQFGYERIAHIFSFSKAYGMPGWRVGALVYPQAVLSDSIRKVSRCCNCCHGLVVEC